MASVWSSSSSLLAFVFPLLLLCSAQKVAINEVAFEGTPAQCNGFDWIELVNYDAVNNIDIGSYELSNGRSKFTFPGNDVVAPGEFLLLCQSTLKLEFVLGDILTLKTSSGVTQSTTTLPTSKGSGATVVVWARTVDGTGGFVLTDKSTPGFTNSIILKPDLSLPQTLQCSIFDCPEGWRLTATNTRRVERSIDPKATASSLNRRGLRADNPIVFLVRNSGSTFLFSDGESDFDLPLSSEKNPILTLYFGYFYEFHVSTSSHPFMIQDKKGSKSSGDNYKKGITGQGLTRGTLFFHVPLDAPAQLWYQCKEHSSMTNSIIIKAPPAKPPLRPTTPTNPISPPLAGNSTSVVVGRQADGTYNCADQLGFEQGLVTHCQVQECCCQTLTSYLVSSPIGVLQPSCLLYGGVDVPGRSSVVNSNSTTCSPTMAALQLAELVLPGLGLCGTIPSILGVLSALTRLDLSRNALSGQMPPALFVAPSLVELSLLDNALTGTVPPEFSLATRLTKVFLTSSSSSSSSVNATNSLCFSETDMVHLLPNYKTRLNITSFTAPYPTSFPVPPWKSLVELQLITAANNDLRMIPPCPVNCWDSFFAPKLATNGGQKGANASCTLSTGNTIDPEGVRFQNLSGLPLLSPLSASSTTTLPLAAAVGCFSARQCSAKQCCVYEQKVWPPAFLLRPLAPPLQFCGYEPIALAPSEQLMWDSQDVGAQQNISLWVRSRSLVGDYEDEVKPVPGPFQGCFGEPRGLVNITWATVEDINGNYFVEFKVRSVLRGFACIGWTNPVLSGFRAYTDAEKRSTAHLHMDSVCARPFAEPRFRDGLTSAKQFAPATDQAFNVISPTVFAGDGGTVFTFLRPFFTGDEADVDLDSSNHRNKITFALLDCHYSVSENEDWTRVHTYMGDFPCRFDLPESASSSAIPPRESLNCNADDVCGLGAACSVNEKGISFCRDQPFIDAHMEYVLIVLFVLLGSYFVGAFCQEKLQLKNIPGTSAGTVGGSGSGGEGEGEGEGRLAPANANQQLHAKGQSKKSHLGMTKLFWEHATLVTRLLFTLADIITDLLFFMYLIALLPYNPGLILFVYMSAAALLVPFFLNICFLVAVLQRSQMLPFWAHFQKHTFSTTLILLLTSFNIALFSLIYSKLFKLKIFGAKIPGDMKSTFAAAAIISNLFEDIPQLAIQTYVVIALSQVQRGDSSTKIDSFVYVSIVLSCLSLAFVMVRRCCTALMVSTVHKAQHEEEKMEEEEQRREKDLELQQRGSFATEGGANPPPLFRPSFHRSSSGEDVLPPRQSFLAEGSLPHPPPPHPPPPHPSSSTTPSSPLPPFRPSFLGMGPRNSTQTTPEGSLIGHPRPQQKKRMSLAATFFHDDDPELSNVAE